MAGSGNSSPVPVTGLFVGMGFSSRFFLDFQWILMYNSHFDLVLLDIEMPGAGGFEIAREIQGRNPEQRIVMVTGRDPGMTERIAGEHGVSADDYLYKPFTYAGVKAMLRNVFAPEETVSA